VPLVLVVTLCLMGCGRIDRHELPTIARAVTECSCTLCSELPEAEEVSYMEATAWLFAGFGLLLLVLVATAVYLPMALVALPALLVCRCVVGRCVRHKGWWIFDAGMCEVCEAAMLPLPIMDPEDPDYVVTWHGLPIGFAGLLWKLLLAAPGVLLWCVGVVVFVTCDVLYQCLYKCLDYAIACSAGMVAPLVCACCRSSSCTSCTCCPRGERHGGSAKFVLGRSQSGRSWAIATGTVGASARQPASQTPLQSL
jgi:hypothetical protein